MTRNERDRQRYATNAESRARQRERQNEWARARYASDPEYRAKIDAKSLERSFLHRTWGFGSTF